jgi:hypothetical protein
MRWMTEHPRSEGCVIAHSCRDCGADIGEPCRVDEEELESWIHCVQIEYLLDELTIEEMESEIWRYLEAYEMKG